MAADLVQQLLRNPHGSGASRLLNRLLDEFYLGRSLADLKPLLEDASTESAALYVLSNVGIRAQSMIGEIGATLESTNWQSRALAVDAVLTSETDEASVLATAARRIADTHPSVRYAAAGLLRNLSISRLGRALSTLRDDPSATDLVNGIELMMRAEFSIEALPEVLRSSSPVARMCLVIGCMRSNTSSTLLVNLADASGDADVHEVVAFELAVRNASVKPASS